MRQSASGTHAHTPALADTRPRLTTAEFAALNHVKPATVFKRLSETQSFHGIRPLKLATRRLLWPALLATCEGAIAASMEECRHA